MARTRVERNISYDEEREVYYVTFNHAKGADGKRAKTTKTFDEIKDARNALKIFEADKIKGNTVPPSKTTVKDWLTYWMDEIVRPNREQTTCYGYQKIIEN